MSITAALIAAAGVEVEIPDFPVRFKVRAITTAQLVEAGASVLMAARLPGEDQVALAARVNTDPKLMLQGVKLMEAAACAGVVAVSQDGGKSWEEIRLVMDRAQEAQAAGRAHISVVPSAGVTTLGNAVMNLSMDGGAAGERLASFLGGSPGSHRGTRKKGR